MIDSLYDSLRQQEQMMQVQQEENDVSIRQRSIPSFHRGNWISVQGSRLNISMDVCNLISFRHFQQKKGFIACMGC
jgi:hypothetical protein